MVVAGIMTGTSVDAIDIATCEMNQKGDRHAISLLSFSSLPFPDDLRQAILASINGTASMEELSDLPFELARAYASSLEAHYQLSVHRPELLAIHGQTIWHHPPLSTWQAGSGPALSALTKLPVVSDFRSADVALGGQGAPLVPVYDHTVYCSDAIDRVALNIGGMANMTILPAGGSLNSLVAFDCGPGNVWIDHATRFTYGKSYDANGNIARAGRVLQPMLNEMMSFEFFGRNPPKSTGREVFTTAEIERLITKYSHPSSPLEDVVTTVTEVTAWSIADHVHRFAPSTKEILVAGGGSQNSFLIERIAARCADLGVSAGVSVDPLWAEKEAMAFAYLGWLSVQGIPGNVPSVTGASRRAVLGTIARA
jgi:anhydro-N-acetylmuramic acid kinase